MLKTASELKAFQIKHYTQRFSEARTTEERAFLRKQLYDHKKTTSNVRPTNNRIYPLADGKICRQAIRQITVGLGL